MRGFMRKRSGNYQIAVPRGKDDKGKYLYHWETVHGYKAAMDRLDELKAQIKDGKYVKPGKLTVAEFLDQWLKDYAKPNMSSRTYEVFEMNCRNHVKPQLGKILLSSLTTSQISQFYSKRQAAGLSAQTVIHFHTMLHRAFETARTWGLLVNNPANEAELPRVTKPEMKTWNQEEMQQFLAQARKTDYYAFCQLALGEGLRRSELLGLRWSDVDLVFGTVSVNRTLHKQKRGGFIFQPPKTKGSKRSIAMLPTSVLVLTEYYNHCKQVREALDLKTPDDLPVFCHLDTGIPWTPDHVSRAWSNIAEAAKVKHIRLHDARHTMATIMLSMGIHPKIVQERLGHASIQITLDTYSHVLPGLQQAAAKSLDSAFRDTYNNDGQKTSIDKLLTNPTAELNNK